MISIFQARTGTGKTLAFLTPALESRLRHLAENSSPQEYARSVAGTLIITPTRELAVQIANEARLLTQGHPGGFGVHLFVGGDSKRESLRKWDAQRKDFIVATPGRLKDLLQTVRSVSTAMSALETVSTRDLSSVCSRARPLFLRPRLCASIAFVLAALAPSVRSALPIG